MDQADLDRRGLRPQDRWKSCDANAKGCGTGCKEFAAANPADWVFFVFVSAIIHLLFCRPAVDSVFPGYV
jgi:hypothetical protein